MSLRTKHFAAMVIGMGLVALTGWAVDIGLVPPLVGLTLIAVQVVCLAVNAVGAVLHVIRGT